MVNGIKMKAILIKTPEQLYKLKFYNDEDMLACATALLSKQNCDEIFGVVDVEELSMKNDKGIYRSVDGVISYRQGFNKAVELNKDKLFTLEDVRKAFNKGYLMKFNPSDEYTETLTGLVQSLQQPTEIEVTFNLDEKDSEGCLILKKI
jgi:hypothetical protein